MPTTLTARCRRLDAIAAAVCGSVWLCCSPAFAQNSDTAAWATSEAAPSDAEGPSTSANDDAEEDSTAPARTPIQRDQSTSARSSFGDMGRRSWTWAWLPIALVVVLWWIVGRVRNGKARDHNLLPEGVIVPLGRRSIGGGHVVQLIRIGSRILVVTPTAEGLKSLTEIDDPQEVERLVSLCLQPRQGSPGIAGLFGQRPIRTETQSERPQPPPVADVHSRQPARMAVTSQQSRGRFITSHLREVAR